MHKAKERLARMERRHLIAACAVAILLALGIVSGTIALVMRLQQTPAPSTASIALSGEMVCLPHKDTDKPHTLECAYGLHTDDNRYYGLEYSPFSSTVNIGDRVQVQGTLVTGASQHDYDIVGTIKASSITR